MKIRKQDKKRNNKGFSLVELIVVIAIMAVLVAVLAPQFTKYVDRSRQSNDATTVAGIVTSIQTGVADATDYADIDDGVYVVTLGKGTTAATVVAGAPAPTNANAVTDMIAAIEDTCGTLADLQVTAGAWDTVEITVTVGADRTIGVTYANTGGTTGSEFSEYIDGEQTP